MSARTARAAVNVWKCVGSTPKTALPHGTPLRASAITTDRSLGFTTRAFNSTPRPTDSLNENTQSDTPTWDTVPISSSSATSTPAKSASTPWYLSVKPKTATYKSPLAAPLPRLPKSPPPFLAPILDQLDSELGITSLNILDLRAISSERPLSLGSSLIMLFGTARSERHLHISADKLCRFLRSKYGLSPHADGLLGRNEIKLRERRKRRRGKIGISQGAEATEDERIGWVCVNTGSEGDGIVVQLFTKERREELDLEGLWTGIKNRELNRIKQLEEGLKVEEVDLMEEAIKLEEKQKREKKVVREEEEEEFDNSHVEAEKPKPRWMETATTSRKLAFREAKLTDLKDVEGFTEQFKGEGDLPEKK